MRQKREKRAESFGVQKFSWHVLFGKKRTIAGAVIILCFVFSALFAPVLAPHDPLLVDIGNKLQGPSPVYLFGTDQLGRCILSRLIWGSRYSLFYSSLVLVITVAVGVPVGMLSGYMGGKVDSLLMRVIDIFMALPPFIVALAIAGTLGASGRNLVLAMSLVYWADYARLSRTLTLQIKEQNYMMALKASGCSGVVIVFRHILKNIAPSVAALATMDIGTIILSIAGFSFIGLGVQAPAPEWGIMLSDSKQFIQTCPRLMIFPGLTIVLIVLAFNLLGEGIQDEYETE
ncbi:MAG: ABC transporter permease subunit [Eubacterium sp.]|nr:ABC transporter permease subunit [Eubacterium sp.]